MTPEISEFSYGFALTNELVGWLPIRAAPMFPSLIEEGKAGGGYDVKLDSPGVPLYIQFKRADCMLRKSAVEIRDHGLPLSIPFYRFKITESGKSSQHEMLLDLDNGTCVVVYAAPRFHRLAEINNAWEKNEVASRSIFIKPSVIGALDAESHHVAYDQNSAYLKSEPRLVESLNGQELADTLSNQLSVDKRPLGEKIQEILGHLLEVGGKARTRPPRPPQRRPTAIGTDDGTMAYRLAVESTSIEIDSTPPQPLLPSERVPTRQRLELTASGQTLRDISDTASRLFNLQLLIVQPQST